MNQFILQLIRLIEKRPLTIGGITYENINGNWYFFENVAMMRFCSKPYSDDCLLGLLLLEFGQELHPIAKAILDKSDFRLSNFTVTSKNNSTKEPERVTLLNSFPITKTPADFDFPPINWN